MRILLIGAPGSGKGTQAVRLADRYGLTHISSGDLLRQHVREETALGLAAKQYVARGDLVPDGLVMDMLFKPVTQAVATGGYVLDGFPRTVDQASTAYVVARQHGAEVQIAVHIDVPDDELVRRLLARARGSEDAQDVIEHRLEVYAEKTVPLIAHYAARAEILAVDGAQPMDDVTASIVTQLDNAGVR